MVSVHRAHVHERDDLASRHELSETSIEKRSGSQRPLEEQYTFFQQMRGYVRDLVECLNEKVGLQLVIYASCQSALGGFWFIYLFSPWF